MPNQDGEMMPLDLLDEAMMDTLADVPPSVIASSEEIEMKLQSVLKGGIGPRFLRRFSKRGMFCFLSKMREKTYTQRRLGWKMVDKLWMFLLVLVVDPLVFALMVFLASWFEYRSVEEDWMVWVPRGVCVAVGCFFRVTLLLVVGIDSRRRQRELEEMKERNESDARTLDTRFIEIGNPRPTSHRKMVRFKPGDDSTSRVNSHQVLRARRLQRDQKKKHSCAGQRVVLGLEAAATFFTTCAFFFTLYPKSMRSSVTVFSPRYLLYVLTVVIQRVPFLYVLLSCFGALVFKFLFDFLVAFLETRVENFAPAAICDFACLAVCATGACFLSWTAEKRARMVYVLEELVEFEDCMAKWAREMKANLLCVTYSRDWVVAHKLLEVFSKPFRSRPVAVRHSDIAMMLCCVSIRDLETQGPVEILETLNVVHHTFQEAMASSMVLMVNVAKNMNTFYAISEDTAAICQAAADAMHIIVALKRADGAPEVACKVAISKNKAWMTILGQKMPYWSLFGPCVTECELLCDIAAPDEIVVSDEIYQLTREIFRYHEQPRQGDIEPDGLAGRVQGYVLHERKVSTRAAATVVEREHHTPLPFYRGAGSSLGDIMKRKRAAEPNPEDDQPCGKCYPVYNFLHPKEAQKTCSRRYLLTNVSYDWAALLTIVATLFYALAAGFFVPISDNWWLVVVIAPAVTVGLASFALLAFPMIAVRSCGCPSSFFAIRALLVFVMALMFYGLYVFVLAKFTDDVRGFVYHAATSWILVVFLFGLPFPWIHPFVAVSCVIFVYVLLSLLMELLLGGGNWRLPVMYGFLNAGFSAVGCLRQAYVCRYFRLEGKYINVLKGLDSAVVSYEVTLQRELPEPLIQKYKKDVIAKHFKVVPSGSLLCLQIDQFPKFFSLLPSKKSALRMLDILYGSLDVLAERVFVDKVKSYRHNYFVLSGLSHPQDTTKAIFRFATLAHALCLTLIRRFRVDSLRAKIGIVSDENLLTGLVGSEQHFFDVLCERVSDRAEGICHTAGAGEIRFCEKTYQRWRSLDRRDDPPSPGSKGLESLVGAVEISFPTGPFRSETTKESVHVMSCGEPTEEEDVRLLEEIIEKFGGDWDKFAGRTEGPEGPAIWQPSLKGRSSDIVVMAESESSDEEEAVVEVEEEEEGEVAR